MNAVFRLCDGGAGSRLRHDRAYRLVMWLEVSTLLRNTKFPLKNIRRAVCLRPRGRRIRHAPTLPYYKWMAKIIENLRVVYCQAEWLGQKEDRWRAISSGPIYLQMRVPSNDCKYHSTTKECLSVQSHFIVDRQKRQRERENLLSIFDQTRL